MYLITPSLLNSFSYYFRYEPEDSEGITAEEKEAEARREFLQSLSREKGAPTEAMQRGIDFEDRVFAYCNGHEDESEPVREIGELCRGGMWQVSVKRRLDEFLLYARADVIKRDTAYDIKCSKSYELGKYQGSMQHRIELFCTGLPRFSYLISDERSWWREDYFNHPGIEQELREALYNFTGYLRNDAEAKALYYSKWIALEAA
jgi:hypothetical protein